MNLLLNQPNAFGNFFLQPTLDNTLNYGGSVSTTSYPLQLVQDALRETSGMHQRLSNTPQRFQLYSTKDIYGLSSSPYIQQPKSRQDSLLPNLRNYHLNSDSSKESSKLITKKDKPSLLTSWYPGTEPGHRRDTGYLAEIQRRNKDSHPVARVKRHERKRIRKRSDVVSEEGFLSPEEEKVKDIGNNDAIFKSRQQDLSWIPSAAATVFQIASFLSNMFGGGQSANSGSSSANLNNVDRIDSISSAATGANDLDVAVGTLMAYGGKYLRQMGLWAFEYASQIPSEALTSASALPDQDAASSLIGGNSQAKPYISTIPLEELEKLGQSAVEKGADPTRLQQAFADAQINGNWSKLENEIAAALGPNSVKGPNPLQINLANILSFAENNLGSASTPVAPSLSASSTGPASTSDATLLDKISYVINGNPNRDPFTQVSFLTRLVTEFDLQDEYLGLEENLNTFIGNVNTVLGEETPTPNIDKIDQQIDQEPISSSESTPGFMAYVSNALSPVFQFLLPNSQKGPENKLDTVGPDDGVATQSQVRPLVDLSDPSTVTLGLLGSAALGGIALAYLSNGGSILPGAKRRSDVADSQPYNKIDMDYAFGGFLDEDDLDYPYYDSYLGQGSGYVEGEKGAIYNYNNAENNKNSLNWDHQAPKYQPWEQQPTDGQQWSHQTIYQRQHQYKPIENLQWGQHSSKWQQQYETSALQQQQSNFG